MRFRGTQFRPSQHSEKADCASDETIKDDVRIERDTLVEEGSDPRPRASQLPVQTRALAQSQGTCRSLPMALNTLFQAP